MWKYSGGDDPAVMGDSEADPTPPTSQLNKCGWAQRNWGTSGYPAREPQAPTEGPVELRGASDEVSLPFVGQQE
ncbi:hypothetical protein NDU88_008988 [Pleurodeles waltl]|uniref:Uncharacterized protein n=1 Tax=Pleurodeles waltl TaxID=8319 RepID=A0AAV7NZD2_PLEWA|nr:hypothetical protein NDU88_008988 [Pleurodeles waltl]